MHLNSNSVEELKWWVKSLELSNSRTNVQYLPQLTIQTDESKKGKESMLPGRVSGGTMEQTGVIHADKHPGTEDCAFGSFNFHQDVPKHVFRCSNVQYGSSDVALLGNFSENFAEVGTVRHGSFSVQDI